MMKIYPSYQVVAHYIGGYIVLAFALALGNPSSSMAASGNHYRVSMSPPSAELIIMFSHTPLYKVRETRQGYVVDFEHALELSDMSQANKRLSMWVKNIVASYDTLLLQLQPDVTLDLKTTGNDLHVILRSVKSADKTGTEELSASTVELERLNALLMFEEGRIEEAGDHLKALLKRHPENTQLLLDLARVEEKLYNWREAISLYERAESLKPYALSIKRAKANLLRVYGSRIRTEAIYSQVGSENKHTIGKIQGRKLMSDGTAWFADYAYWDVKNDYGVRQLDGDIEPFYGQRQSLSLGLETELFSGEQKILLYAGDKQAGAGWIYTDGSDYGWFVLQLLWQQPWYETSEAVAGYGYRDRVALGYSNSFGKNLSLSSDLSANRYGLDAPGETVRSYQLQMAVRYWMLNAGDGFSLGYAVDIEHTFDHLELQDSLGNTFTLMPLDSREQQVVDLGWNKRLTESLFMETYLGYEFDLSRDVNAPFGRLNLSYSKDQDFEAALNVATGLTNYNEGSDQFFSIGGSLSWFF